MKETKEIGLGVLMLPLTERHYFRIWGGPYVDKPVRMSGVKMAAEIDRQCDVDIPTKDFRVPDRKLLYRGVSQAVDLILAGKPVYAGCMGGKGRTGLFLAVLAKTFGIKDPVKYVRANYYSHAVETSEQAAFVKAYIPSPQDRIKLKKARRRAWFKFWKTNLTNHLTN